MRSEERVAGNTDAAARLFAAAEQVLVERGLAGASARVIADRAGSSASAIHYHFSDVETLIIEALTHARERDRRWRRELLNSLTLPSLSSELFPFIMHGIVTTAGHEHRTLTLLHWDVALSAVLQKRYRNVASAWRDDIVGFWQAVLDVFQITTPARLVAEFADAASRLYLAAGSGPTHIAWVTETVARFAERLCAGGHSIRAGTLWRDLHRNAALPSNAGENAKSKSEIAARIVEGALQVVLKQGPHALTHRSVANAAGVSLSSTTYHFTSRGEILHAAFAQLRARTLERIAAWSSAKPSKRLEFDELIELMSAALVTSAPEISREYVAAQSLLHAAARDAALRPHAQQLYANMGEATLALFQRTRGLCERSDPLSTFIFALWTDAMLCNAGLERPSAIARYVRTQQQAMISLLAPQG